MAQKSYICPKCGGPMSRGFVSERGDNSSRFVARWTEGDPLQVQRFGITGENVQVDGRRQFSIRSLRCENCGFLELYAV